LEVSLDDLYKEVILDHYQNPRNRGKLESPDIATRGHNPLCGDEVELALNVDGESVRDIAFGGRGCSISLASASMMTEYVKGQTLGQAEELADAFKAVMTANGSSDSLGQAEELQALQGVKRYPVRVKCALLPWSALEEAFELYRKRTM
jgi:nitrogen fixation protein NifU and related proteins